MISNVLFWSVLSDASCTQEQVNSCKNSGKIHSDLLFGPTYMYLHSLEKVTRDLYICKGAKFPRLRILARYDAKTLKKLTPLAHFGSSFSGADPEIYRWVGQVWNVGHIDALARQTRPKSRAPWPRWVDHGPCGRPFVSTPDFSKRNPWWTPIFVNYFSITSSKYP